MEKYDRRPKNIRMGHKFPVKLVKEGSEALYLEGMAVNLSRKRAFIKSENRLSLEAHVPVVLTFFLPPDFTVQNKTIGLQGDAVITRIDQENEGVAVEFIKTFREFERIDVPDLDEKSDNSIGK
jgi:hypothetical protein